MQPSRPNTPPSNTLPDGYVAKTEGTVAPDDLIWNATDGRFESSDTNVPAIGHPVQDVSGVATPAHWVTYDTTTGVVWGVGESPEESIRAAKFGAYGDDHGGVGYEFSCWCDELHTKSCSERFYASVRSGDQRSVQRESQVSSEPTAPR